MCKPRLLYQDWIVELGRDPHLIELNRFNNVPEPVNVRIIDAVRSALKRLSSAEREFIELYYFRGCSLREIAAILHKRATRMPGLHRRALNKLKRELASFVREEFGIDTATGMNCLLCNSPHRMEIDRLILAKPERETWKRIIRILKNEFNIEITTPQILIGHLKYHIKRGE